MIGLNRKPYSMNEGVQRKQAQADCYCGKEAVLLTRFVSQWADKLFISRTQLGIYKCKCKHLFYSTSPLHLFAVPSHRI